MSFVNSSGRLRVTCVLRLCQAGTPLLAPKTWISRVSLSSRVTTGHMWLLRSTLK